MTVAQRDPTIAAVNADDFTRARHELGLTQRALADALGVRQSTIHRWERGQRAIPNMAGLALEALARRQAPVETPNENLDRDANGTLRELLDQEHLGTSEQRTLLWDGKTPLLWLAYDERRGRWTVNDANGGRPIAEDEDLAALVEEWIAGMDRFA